MLIQPSPMAETSNSDPRTRFSMIRSLYSLRRRRWPYGPVRRRFTTRTPAGVRTPCAKSMSSPPVGGLSGVGGFKPADLVVGEGDVHRGDGIGEVVGFGGSDDGCGHDRLRQQPGDADLGHRHPALFSDLLDDLHHGLVDVEVEGLGDL